MLLPKLNTVRKSTELTDRFLGYQHIEAPADGAFYNAENISTVRFPVLCPRLPRGKVRTLAAPGGLFAKEKLAWVDGGQLFYGGEVVAEVSEGQKTFSSLGAWLIVWPDGLRYNTHDGTVDRLAQANTTAGEVTFTLTMSDGTPYEDIERSDTAPEDLTKYWLYTGEEPHVLKKYDPATKLWNSIPTTYVRISAPGIGHGLAAGDTVTVSGVTGAAAGDFNQDMVLWSTGEDEVLVTAIIDETFTQEEPVTLERKVPAMDFVTSLDNRLWGCSNATNEIFACKLGDPTNWYSYQGLAGDSYAATVGSDGPFTGAASHNGYVLFFKSGCIHKVYGTKPANFQITQVMAPGVQPGSESSLCQLGGVLYYKAEHAVMAYDGSLPEDIGRALGPVHYANAVGGSCRGRYYLCMTGPGEERSLFCYDPATGLWAREDGADAAAFAETGDGAWMLDRAGVLWELAPHQTPDESDGPVQWWAETGILDLYELDAHYHNRLQLRLWLPEGSTFALEVQYDGGDWLTLREIEGKAEQSMFIAAVLRRCDRARLRLRGTGPCRIYAMSRVTRTGSEVRLGRQE